MGPDLTVESLPDVFVIGDAASVTDESGEPVPGIAPAAKQQGRYVADVLRARLDGRSAPGPFRYRHAGNLATIGRGAGVAEFPRLRVTGFPAWVLWGRRPRVLPDRPAEPPPRHAALALGVRDLPPRSAADHRLDAPRERARAATGTTQPPAVGGATPVRDGGV